MKKIILAIVVVILAMVAFLLSTNNSSQPVPDSNETLPISTTITTPTNQKIQVRIADDERERELGLSYFKRLPDDQGMLFLFDAPDRYGFWMKDTNFALDIIWLKRISPNSFEVVHVADGVDPSSYPTVFYPEGAADAVLEVNAQKGKGFGIVKGGVVRVENSI